MKKINALQTFALSIAGMLMLIISLNTKIAYATETIEFFRPDSSSAEIITDYEQRSFIYNDDIVPLQYEERIENGVIHAIRVISEEEYLRSLSSPQIQGRSSGTMAMAAAAPMEYYTASPTNASIYRDGNLTITTNVPYQNSFSIDVVKPESQGNHEIQAYNQGNRVYMSIRGISPETFKVRINYDYAGNYTYLRCTNFVTVNVLEKPGFVPTMNPATDITLALNGTRQFSTNFFENMMRYGYKLNYEHVNWTSSNPAVATVTKNTTGGLVTAKAAGTATITAESICGAYKLYRKVTVTPGPVSAVSGFKTTAQTNNSITLAWNADTNATSYDISYGSTTVNVTGTSRVITGLSAGTEYAFKIRAKNSAYTGSYTSELKVRTKYPTITVPANLHSTATGAASITMAWNAVTGATGYDILVGSTAISVTGTTYTATGLNPKTDYNFQVRAKNPDYTGAYTAIVTVKTDKMPLEAPGIINVVEKTHEMIIISWPAVEDALSYVINYGAGEIPSATTSATIAGLTPDTEYIIKIKSVDERGESPYGTPISIRTEPEPLVPLENLVVASKTHTSITLSWDSVTEASVYEIIYNGQIITSNTSSVTITGLLPETEYLFKISGKNAGVTFAYSEISVQTSEAVVGIPENIICTEKTRNSISLTWSSVDEAESYIVNYSGESLVVQNNSIVIGGLNEDTEYTITVQAKSRYVTGAASQSVIVKTYPQPYAAVTGLKYTERTGNSISLEWNEVEGFYSYEVKFGNSIISFQENEAFITGLSPGTKYDFMVRIISDENVGEWSNPLTVFTLRGSSTLNAEVVINAQNTKTYDIAVAGENLPLNGSDIFTITYDTNVLQLANFATHVPGSHTSTGTIPDTDIQVTSISNGVIQFKFTYPVDENHVWSGIFTIAKFKALSTQSTTVFIEQ